MNDGKGQAGFAAMDEHATAIADDQQHANEPHGNEAPPSDMQKLPVDGLAKHKSIKVVRAGLITEVVPAGCYVKEKDGSAILRTFEPKMTDRYQPVVGDYWVVYDDGYQAISPAKPFEEGYVPYSVGECSTSEPSAKAFDNVRQLPVHAMHVENGDDGTQTVHYLSRAGEEQVATLPKGHGILENFHRAMEAYWADLEGAAAEFKSQMVEL